MAYPAYAEASLALLARSLRLPHIAFLGTLDDRYVVPAFGFAVIAVLATGESIATGDGIAIFQRFGAATATLAVWSALFLLVLRPLRFYPSAKKGAGYPAIAGIFAAGVLGWLLLRLASGQPWGSFAVTSVCYVIVVAVSLLRGDFRGDGLAMLIGIQIASVGLAGAIVPKVAVLPFAAIVTVGLLFISTFATSALGAPAKRYRPVRRLRTWLDRALRQTFDYLREIRPLVPILATAVGSTFAVWLVIGGQPSTLGKVFIPLTGLAASRLVAEEILLRVWAIPSIEKRIGSSWAIILTAVVSAVLAAILRPAGASIGASLAIALSAALASGMLWRGTRSAPAVILFRLLVP